MYCHAYHLFSCKFIFSFRNISGMSNALKQLVANADGNSDYSDNDSDEDYWG